MAASITNKNIEKIYEAAIKSGAYGGKVSGAGGGGFMFFTINPVKRVALIDTLNQFNGKVINFLQNRNYLALVPLKIFAWRTRLRIVFEQTVAYLLRRRCAIYWVQTSSMAREVRNWYGNESVKIRVLPFAPKMTSVTRSTRSKWDFVYVADGEAHKNHKCLVEAWVLLAQYDIKPTLALTLSERDTALWDWIQKKIVKHGLLITNLGRMPYDAILGVYGNSNALVFPSIGESYGLPLIEASQIGLPILASELDYVREVCNPVQSFDPQSPLSIARAIRRFVDKVESPTQPASAAEFFCALRGS
jgi:glycosyltransferase involved in cell wall biosynthesis